MVTPSLDASAARYHIGNVPAVPHRRPAGFKQPEMHIITRKRLTDFAAKHPETEGPLAVWYRTVKAKRYQKQAEVLQDFPKVDFIGDYRAVFNIAKQYRLVCDMRFDLSRAFVRHIVTHDGYERLMKRRLL
jgi:mRNA interferase HigB